MVSRTYSSIISIIYYDVVIYYNIVRHIIVYYSIMWYITDVPVKVQQFEREKTLEEQQGANIRPAV